MSGNQEHGAVSNDKDGNDLFPGDVVWPGWALFAGRRGVVQESTYSSAIVHLVEEGGTASGTIRSSSVSKR